MPTIAFGTGSALKGRDVTDFVEQALESGFDHIDTAASPYHFSYALVLAVLIESCIMFSLPQRRQCWNRNSRIGAEQKRALCYH